MNNEEVICKKVAELLQGRDWHKMSLAEREIVKDLELAGWINPNKPANGFVGKAEGR